MYAKKGTNWSPIMFCRVSDNYYNHNLNCIIGRNLHFMLSGKYLLKISFPLNEFLSSSVIATQEPFVIHNNIPISLSVDQR